MVFWKLQLSRSSVSTTVYYKNSFFFENEQKPVTKIGNEDSFFVDIRSLKYEDN